MAVGDEEDLPGMDEWPVVVEGEGGDYDYADEGDVGGVGDVAIYMVQAREDILEAVENAVVAGEDAVEAM